MEEFINNRHSLRLSILVENEDGDKGLVFIIHGLSGSREQPHIKVMREVFAQAGYVTVSFDTTHAFGNSEGELIDATTTSYIEDLEDVVGWAEQQVWYSTPFVIAGHSLGGISQLVYASNNLSKIKALAPLGTVVSGRIWHDTADPDFLKEWEERGHYNKVSQTLEGKSGQVGWNLHQDMMKYDVLEFADQITCPVLLIAGSEEDAGTAPDVQRQLYDELGGKKDFHIVEGMPHTPRTDVHLSEYRRIITDWVNSL